MPTEIYRLFSNTVTWMFLRKVSYWYSNGTCRLEPWQGCSLAHLSMLLCPFALWYARMKQRQRPAPVWTRGPASRACNQTYSSPAERFLQKANLWELLAYFFKSLPNCCFQKEKKNVSNKILLGLLLWWGSYHIITVTTPRMQCTITFYTLLSSETVTKHNLGE